MKQIVITYSLLLFTLTGFGQERYSDQNYSKEIKELNINDWVYIGSCISSESPDSLYNIKPIDYLNYLGTFEYDIYDSISNNGNSNKKYLPTIPFKYKVKNSWLQKDDIDTLIQYVHSKELAYMPFSIYSSQAPFQNTTIGIEAMHLISLHKDQDFLYPSLCSVYYFCKPKDQEKLTNEFIKWWKENRN